MEFLNYSAGFNLQDFLSKQAGPPIVADSKKMLKAQMVHYVV